MTHWDEDVRQTKTDVGDPSGDTLTSLTAKLGDGATTVVADLATVKSNAYDSAIKNVMMDRDMPYLTEFWATESLDGAYWEETLDGGSTGAFTNTAGYMYYAITAEGVADQDAWINSKYRWQVRPSQFSDTNCELEAINLEFVMRMNTVAYHDDSNFFLGFMSDKTTDVSTNDLAGFVLVGTDLKGKTDDSGDDETTGAITGTLTNWNKYKLRLSSDGAVFSFNESAETALSTYVPDYAMYLVFGTRAVGANAAWIHMANIRVWYEEVV